MEVLLLHDIPGVGKKNDLLVVGDGYALNNLLPNRIALVATPTVRRRYAEQIKRRAEERAKELAAQHSAASLVHGRKVSFARKATKTGKLYAAITEKHLKEALSDQLGVDVAETDIKISDQIKAVGEHEALVQFADAEEKIVVEVSEEK